MYTVEQFKADVIAECVALREHATAEELGRLAYRIYPQDPDECIYGLMCGNCRSIRAKELIEKCCKRSVDNKSFHPKFGIGKLINHTAEVPRPFDGYLNYISALEAYIMLADADIPAIQSYLTGQTETLVL